MSVEFIDLFEFKWTASPGVSSSMYLLREFMATYYLRNEFMVVVVLRSLPSIDSDIEIYNLTVTRMTERCRDVDVTSAPIADEWFFFFVMTELSKAVFISVRSLYWFAYILGEMVVFQGVETTWQIL